MEKFVCIEDFEKEAFKVLDRNSLDYYKSGADDEITLKENKNAFKRWIIRPRMMVDVRFRNLQTNILGKPVSFPLGISPTAMQKLAHPDGEMANARAAEAMGTIFIQSTISTCSVEEVAKAAPKCRKWLQLYVYKEKKIAEDLVKRAENVGFEAIVLTVDAPYFGKRRANLRHQFYLPPHLRMGNFAIGSDASEGIHNKEGSAINSYISKIMDQSLTWKDLSWLKSISKLPIIVKGILTAEDAVLALEYGADAIMVSNHGARQLDTVLPTIDALPGCVDAVKGKCEIYIDGGFSTGGDVFKALALGANMCFAGRPFIWALASFGQEGSEKALKIYKDELDLTMALSGISNISQIKKEYVAPYLKSNL